jgi:hypothetical protein
VRWRITREVEVQMTDRVGMVRISRGIWTDTAFKDERYSEREAFIWLIMEASFSEREKRLGSVSLTLERGQLAASTRFMADAWKWSEARVRRYLERVENRRMIRRVTDAGVTVITVCKYDEYQSPIRVTDAPTTQEATQQRRTGDANYNKLGLGGGGGCARAREASPMPFSGEDRQRLLSAIGADVTPDGHPLGRMADMQEFCQWRNDLGLDLDTICAVIGEVMAGKRDGPPHSFAYFTKAMQRAAGAAQRPTLTPIIGGLSHEHAYPHSQRPVREDPKRQAIRGIAQGFLDNLTILGSGGGNADQGD